MLRACMDVAAVTRGVVNMWVWLKSLQLCCSASATPTFCVTQSAEIGPAAAGPAGPAPTALLEDHWHACVVYASLLGPKFHHQD